MEEEIEGSEKRVKATNLNNPRVVDHLLESWEKSTQRMNDLEISLLKLEGRIAWMWIPIGILVGYEAITFIVELVSK